MASVRKKTSTLHFTTIGIWLASIYVRPTCGRVAEEPASRMTLKALFFYATRFWTGHGQRINTNRRSLFCIGVAHDSDCTRDSTELNHEDDS